MKKTEALKYCKEKRNVGWQTHEMILEIYQDEDEIPQDVLDLVCHAPKRQEAITLYVGIESLNAINEAISEFVKK